MVGKREVDVVVIKMQIKKIALLFSLFLIVATQAQSNQDSTAVYKKRVLETTEVNFLSSYYTQDGDNAAVSGGLGTEKLTDVTGTIIVSIPLNDDDVLTIDAGISAYTSASSSNVDAFDGSAPADPFVASTGASSSDLWKNVTGSYSHSSDDRNSMWSAKLSMSSEFDYSSIGVGGGFTQLFNEKNTELSIHGNVYLDTWKPIYPTELRPFQEGGDGLNNQLFTRNTITGNTAYNPIFTPYADKNRNSYSLGLGFSQILHKKVQGSLALDIVQQQGLLSTPLQRVYFADVDDSFIDNFQLADAIERLPDSRFKVAIGGRLNWYLNEILSVRTFYRYYFDNWGFDSHTASLELPIKVSSKFTLYPSFRYYNQTASDYFRPFQEALSTETYYTSDYDLSQYSSNQLGFGVSYTDIFTKIHVVNFGLKTIDLKMYKYARNTTFTSSFITVGFKFVMD
jgi:hypothetical protein